MSAQENQTNRNNQLLPVRSRKLENPTQPASIPVLILSNTFTAGSDHEQTAKGASKFNNA